MSLSTSKSKTQLAYARSTKPVNKPKGKNASTIESGDSNRNRNGPRNSTGNIYESIMGQIEPKQQNYIKSLIVKNEKQTIKQEKQQMADKEAEGISNLVNNQSKKSLVNSSVANGKLVKQVEVPMAKQSLNGHQRTRSHAQLIIKDTGVIESTKSIAHVGEERQVSEVSCNESQGDGCEEVSKESRVNLGKGSNSKETLVRGGQVGSGESVLERVGLSQSKDFRKEHGPSGNNVAITASNLGTSSTCKNPIIQALHNTSSSFSKKLETFQLQYPEQREQRSTHKKVSSKLAGEYFSCQTSPKHAKNVYTKEIVVTIKTPHQYHNHNRNQPVSASISPISSTKNSNHKIHPRLQAAEPIATNFISCLDDYLEALTFNTTVSETIHENPRPSNTNANMKRSNSSKFKEFSTSNGHPFTLGEEEEEETVLIGNRPYSNSSKLKSQLNPTKLLSPSQQQKLLKQLSHQRKKVSELNSIIEMFHQQLAKYKKKQTKLKQNQYHMIEVMKELNEQLTQERNQRRKLQGVVSEFESKIRGISRGKDKLRRDSVEDDERPERKTIYGSSSLGNSIHFKHHQKNGSKLEKHSKKPSFNRLSSMINSVNYNNCHEDRGSYKPYFNEQKQVEEGFFKNKTQKFSKIISNFELENQPCEEEQEMYFRSRNFPEGNARMNNNDRQSHKNPGQSHKNPAYLQPSSCKNSHMNSSMPSNGKSRSRPMTPKLVEELFKSTKNYEYETKNYSSSSESYQSEQEYENEFEGNEFETESEIRPTDMSGEEGGGEEQEYLREVIKRMR